MQAISTLPLTQKDYIKQIAAEFDMAFSRALVRKLSLLETASSPNKSSFSGQRSPRMGSPRQGLPVKGKQSVHVVMAGPPQRNNLMMEVDEDSQSSINAIRDHI